MSHDDVYAWIESCITPDLGGRGLTPFALGGQVALAASSLLAAKHVIIATGFWIPAAAAAETDGPPGAIELAHGLSQRGIPVSFLTDHHCAPSLERAGLEPLLLDEAIDSLPPDVTHLIAIERLGRANDGRYYNMRGEDLTEYTSAIDRWFCKTSEIRTIGIGDGGNEIGMGRIHRHVVQNVRFGPKIASVVETDFLIVGGTSNWGVWGLLAAMSAATTQDLLPTVESARRTLARCVDAGMVDAMSTRPIAQVDGLTDEQYFGPLQAIRDALDGDRQ